MTTYQIGDIVFAKIKGSRHWPAKILEKIVNENKQTKYNILFFGENKTAIVKDINLAAYCENIHTYGAPLVENFKNKHFNTALKEAQIYFNSTSRISNTGITDTNTTLSQCANSISDIQDKIKNLNEEPDLETSLTLAAEVGNVLLTENTNLRTELQKQILENAKLAQRILDLSNTNQITQQDQLDILKNENQALLNRVNDLVQALNEVERQLEVEKQLRSQLSVTFEDYDKEKEEVIKKYENTVKEQQKLIEDLKTNKGQSSSSVELKKTTKNSGTQTNYAEQITENKSNLLVEIERVKIRLEMVEGSINSLHNLQQNTEVRTNNVPNNYLTQNPTPGASQTMCKNLNKPPINITDLYDTGDLTPRDSQTKSKRLNHCVLTNNNMNRPFSKAKNLRSVSLQAAKHRAFCKPISGPTPATHTFRVSNGPPESAKLLGTNETFEDFYIKHFEEAIKQQTMYHTFLGHTTEKKSRFKSVPKQRKN